MAMVASGAEDPSAAEEYQEAEEFGEGELTSNSLGFSDGRQFFLRSFAVWYRWRPQQYQQAYNFFDEEKPETGEERGGLYFEQTMGRIVLWCELEGKAEGATADSISVDISCWEMNVTLGTDGKPGKRPGKKIDAISGEFWADIRRKYSWWQILEDGECEFPGRWMVVSLAKVKHRPWAGVWAKLSMNIHKKNVFGWVPQTPHYKLHGQLQMEEESLAYIPAGEPQDQDKSLSTGILPERLCSGIDDDEDETDEQISILLHCDAETLEQATGMVPLEELFAADVDTNRLDVYLRHDGLGLCSGQLVGRCIPELTTWEMTTVRRRLPKDTTIKAPAFYNQALRITLVKALGYQGTWSHAFADVQTPQWEPPRERESWTDRVQRALVLSPAAPMSLVTKTERALKLCVWVDSWQDAATGKAFVLLHLDGRLNESFGLYKVDPTSFFALKVGDDMLEVRVVADCEFRMIVGSLGGKCVPDKTSWDLIPDQRNSEEDERVHMALRIGLVKTQDSRGTWPLVFNRLEPWEVTDNMHKSLADSPPDGLKVKESMSESNGAADPVEEPETVASG